MRERFLARAVVLCGGLLTLAVLADRERPARLSATDEPKPAAAAGTFGPTRVWAVHVEIPAKEFEAMQPPLDGGFGPPAPKKSDKKRESEKNLFGTEFPWAEANFTADGTTLKKVGVRYSGDITYFVPAGA